VSALADDDGMSETSTAWEKERWTGFSRGGSARLAEAARRGDDLEAELRSTRGELWHERARLAALSTRLGAVEATLRLERESMRPEREKLVAMAMDAVDRATGLNDVCRALHATNAALRSELDDYKRRDTGSTVGLRRSLSSRTRAARAARAPSFSAASPARPAVARSASATPTHARPAPERGASWRAALPSPMKYCAVRRYYRSREMARDAAAAGDDAATVEDDGSAAEAKGEPEPYTPGTDAKGAQPGRYSDGDESPASPVFERRPSNSPGGLGDQTEEELRGLRDALYTVKTALVEMRTRSSLVSDDSDPAIAPL